MLTWALCLATYNRPEDLRTCVLHALAQSRPPSEIVIVDGTPSMEAYRADLQHLVSVHAQDISLLHVREHNPSAARQRNRALQLATADACFLIDDDTILYPTAAAKIMRLYENDRNKVVPAISGMLTHQRPPAPNSPAWQSAVRGVEPDEGDRTLQARDGFLRRSVRALLKADEIEIPYDEDWPKHPVPEELQVPTVGTRRAIAGHTMTVRRDDALAEPFEEMLERYSSGEDADMSYRLSRRGPLLTALDAWMYHPPIAGRSLPPFLLATVQATNQIVLQRKNATNLDLAKARLKRILRRRVLIEAAKDMYYRDPTAPRTRAFLIALRRLDSFFDMSVDELREAYPKLQRDWFRMYCD